MENLQLSRSYFNVLVRKMGNPEFPNDEALLKHLLVTPGAVAVFVELVTWLPYSKRPDGSIYKSDAQLAKATRRSAKTVERTRKILREAGFTIEVKKANGAPTNHYRFDLEKFIAFAANKLRVTVDQMREWMFSAAEKMGKKSVSDRMSKSVAATAQKDELNSDQMSKSPPPNVGNSSRPNVEVDFDKTTASLTTSPNTEKTDRNQDNGETATTPYITLYEQIMGKPPEKAVVVVDSSSLKIEIYSLAVMLKIQQAMVERWVVQYGLDRVKDVAKRAVEDPNVRNPGGWAKRALESSFQWAEKVPAVTGGNSYISGPYADFIHH